MNSCQPNVERLHEQMEQLDIQSGQRHMDEAVEEASSDGEVMVAEKHQTSSSNQHATRTKHSHSEQEGEFCGEKQRGCCGGRKLWKQKGKHQKWKKLMDAYSDWMAEEQGAVPPHHMPPQRRPHWGLTPPHMGFGPHHPYGPHGMHHFGWHHMRPCKFKRMMKKWQKSQGQNQWQETAAKQSDCQATPGMAGSSGEDECTATQETEDMFADGPQWDFHPAMMYGGPFSWQWGFGECHLKKLRKKYWKKMKKGQKRNESNKEQTDGNQSSDSSESSEDDDESDVMHNCMHREMFGPKHHGMWNKKKHCKGPRGQGHHWGPGGHWRRHHHRHHMHGADGPPAMGPMGPGGPLYMGPAPHMGQGRPHSFHMNTEGSHTGHGAPHHVRLEGPLHLQPHGIPPRAFRKLLKKWMRGELKATRDEGANDERGEQMDGTEPRPTQT